MPAEQMFLFIAMLFLGSLGGMLVGALPGLSVTMATALLVSLTYTWDFYSALGLIIGVYVSGVFSGAIPAILLNIPGAPSSVITTLDGYPMSKRGESYKALSIAAVYSFVGGVFGFLILALFAPMLGTIAIEFSSMDYFLLGVIGLTATSSFSSDKKKAAVAAVIGLLISFIGIDPIVGTPRFTFSISELNAGIPLTPALIGFFGMGEVLFKLTTSLKAEKAKAFVRESFPKDIKKHFRLGIISSMIGVIVGALPGAGAPVASLISYDRAKKRTQPKTPFGEGAEEGIVASEAANNACIGGALIPLLTLAVPGDAVTAVILSAFLIHGITPGPRLISSSPELFITIVVGGIIACVFMLLLGLTISPALSKVVTIPPAYLNTVVIILSVIGAYSTQSSRVDVIIMLCCGLLALIMRKAEYPVTPVVLGIVLGPMIDQHLRRALSLARSADNIIINLFFNPITMLLLALFVYTLFAKGRKIEKTTNKK